jgi:hypothetical protein
MKPNLYQKIVLAVFSILMFLTCIIFVPYTVNKGKYVIEYNPIWTAHGIISTQRLIIEIFVVIILSVVFYIYTGNKQVADIQVVKKRIRRELKIIFLGIIMVFLSWGYLSLRNGYYHREILSNENRISVNKQSIDSLRKEILRKKEVRKNFFTSLGYHYNLNWANNDVTSVWDGFLANTITVNKSYPQPHTVRMSDDIIDNNYIIDGHSFANKMEFMDFIYQYKYTDEDIKNDEKAGGLKNENLKLHNETEEYYDKNNDENFNYNFKIFIKKVVVFLK